MVANLTLLLLLTQVPASQAAPWPQFRGPNSSGRIESAEKLPTEIGPTTNVAWKIDLPPGHSSPIVFDDRLYLTAVRAEHLVTMALDRTTGRTLWEAEAPHSKLEPIHRIGSHAQASPATDGQRVVSFFGSSGLFCYDIQGKPLWKQPMGPFNNDFGAGSSPIIAGDRVILCQDHDTDSFLMALDKQSGKILWKTDRSEFPRNYCTPVIWEVGGKRQIVVVATLRVVGYDFETGKELWTVRGIARTSCMTPVVGDDGTLYAASWAAGGDPSESIQVTPFDEEIAKSDANKDGMLSESELPEGPIKMRFSQVDRDKSGAITMAEYNYFRGLFNTGRNVVLAIKPGGEGDVTRSHVVWEQTKHLPFCASPLYYQGFVFTVKDGGILSSIDAQSGEMVKFARLPTAGDFFASPVAGNGKVYLVNDEGDLSVVSAVGKWQVLATAKFGEPVYATPALADGRIYLRTVGHLYCFARPQQ